MTAYVHEILDHEPQELTLDGVDTYIQRINIKKVKREKTDIEGEDLPEYQWECDMRFISVSEYEMLKAFQNVLNGEKEV